MATTSTKLLLIDGNSITYRAFFALPPLSNAKGQFTNAVFGFTQMLLRLLQDEQPTHIAVAFDVGKVTFRHNIYAAYKGTRQRTPSELSEQFPLVKEVLKAFQIPIVELPSFEADDLIGTLATRAGNAGWSTLVVSGDKDLLQLVSPHVHAALTRKGITEVDYYDEAAVQARFGLSPVQIIDLKGLMGDTSDNIPGVPGVGEKTAVKLLQSYPTVEEVLNHIADVSGVKLKERLEEHRDLALLSKQLATINCDVPLAVELDTLAYNGYNAKALRSIFQELGFKSLLDKISGEIEDSTSNGDADSPHSTANPWSTQSVTVISTKSEFATWLGGLNPVVGILPDYDAQDYQTAGLRGLAVSTEHTAYYLSFQSELDIVDVRALFTPDFDKVVFDLKTLVVLLYRHGLSISVDDNWCDVMIASYLLNPSDGELHLTDIVEREFHVTLHNPHDSKGRNDSTDYQEALSRLAMTLPKLKHNVENGLAAQELDDLYARVEIPLAFVLARMELLGFQVNRDWLTTYGAELSKQLAVLMGHIFEASGTEFNINSPKQLGEVLFEKMGLPPSKKTKTGYSTSADVLEKLAPYHDIVHHILEYRQLGKLQSTYVEGLLKVIRKETDRVHTRFHQALTATGRLSSSEPNLQNIPIRMEEGRKLRHAFEPTYPDWVILSADYSQIELRILAHLSADEEMMDAFHQGMDIHTRTASTVFEVAPEEVTSLMRRQAKAVNFGIVYGISDYGLSQNLNISRAQAAQFIEDYFLKFPGVQRYMTEIVGIAKKKGYVTTLLNRRRYLPDIHSSNFNLRSFAERTAMNTPIQGTAADVIKLAMVRIDEALHDAGLTARMLLQVHDELIFECPKEELPALTTIVRENMENAMTLNVPLSVDMQSGDTWYDAK